MMILMLPIATITKTCFLPLSLSPISLFSHPLSTNSPLYPNNLCISRMWTKSSLFLLETHIVNFHSWINSRIFVWTGEGKTGGRSGNLLTNSFRNSFVAIWRWKGYPQFLIRMSKSYWKAKWKRKIRGRLGLGDGERAYSHEELTKKHEGVGNWPFWLLLQPLLEDCQQHRKKKERRKEEGQKS